MDVAIWNLFHDGSIESCSGDVPGDLTLAVSIDYLREMIEPAGELFFVDVRGCTLLELQSWADDSVASGADALNAIQPEILSGSEEDDRAIVICNGYELRLRYDAIGVRLDTGAPLTIDEIDAVAERYWSRLGQHERR
jgi:hypothetical protein